MSRVKFAPAVLIRFCECKTNQRGLIRGGEMRYLILVLIAFVLITSAAGCARANRIADDVEWMFFDGEPWVNN